MPAVSSRRCAPFSTKPTLFPLVLVMSFPSPPWRSLLLAALMAALLFDSCAGQEDACASELGQCLTQLQSGLIDATSIPALCQIVEQYSSCVNSYASDCSSIEGWSTYIGDIDKYTTQYGCSSNSEGGGSEGGGSQYTDSGSTTCTESSNGGYPWACTVGTFTTSFAQNAYIALVVAFSLLTLAAWILRMRQVPPVGAVSVAYEFPTGLSAGPPLVSRYDAPEAVKANPQRRVQSAPTVFGCVRVTPGWLLGCSATDHVLSLALHTTGVAFPDSGCCMLAAIVYVTNSFSLRVAVKSSSRSSSATSSLAWDWLFYFAVFIAIAVSLLEALAVSYPRVCFAIGESSCADSASNLIELVYVGQFIGLLFICLRLCLNAWFAPLARQELLQSQQASLDTRSQQALEMAMMPPSAAGTQQRNMRPYSGEQRQQQHQQQQQYHQRGESRGQMSGRNEMLQRDGFLPRGAQYDSLQVASAPPDWRYNTFQPPSPQPFHSSGTMQQQYSRPIPGALDAAPLGQSVGEYGIYAHSPPDNIVQKLEALQESSRASIDAWAHVMVSLQQQNQLIEQQRAETAQLRQMLVLATERLALATTQPAASDMQRPGTPSRMAGTATRPMTSPPPQRASAMLEEALAKARAERTSDNNSQPVEQP